MEGLSPVMLMIRSFHGGAQPCYVLLLCIKVYIEFTSSCKSIIFLRQFSTTDVGRFLLSYCQDRPGEWAAFIPWAEMAQNSLRHSSTNLSFGPGTTCGG